MSFLWCRTVSVTAIDPFSVACLGHVACRHNEGWFRHTVWGLDLIQKKLIGQQFPLSRRDRTNECEIANFSFMVSIGSTRYRTVAETYYIPLSGLEQILCMDHGHCVDIRVRWMIVTGRAAIARGAHYSWRFEVKCVAPYSQMAFLDYRQSLHPTSSAK